MALMFSRWQISRPTSEVMRSPEGRPMYCRACWILDSGAILRNGDCSSCEARACLSVPSKTVSPVVFTNSVRRMESFSVRALVRRVKMRLPIAAASRAAAAIPAQNHVLERTAGAAPDAELPLVREAAETCELEAAASGRLALFDAGSRVTRSRAARGPGSRRMMNSGRHTAVGIVRGRDGA